MTGSAKSVVNTEGYINPVIASPRLMRNTQFDKGATI